MEWIPRLERTAAAFADLLRTGRLDARVPSCPDWDLHGLADHLGDVHRWAAHAVTDGTPDHQPPPAPTGRDALVAWFEDGAAHLLDVLTGTPPDAPAWTFGPRPRTAAFWPRRLVHETTMHLWDGVTSQGATGSLDEDVARDGLDEVATLFFPRQVRLGRAEPLRHSLALQVQDGPRVVLAGDGTGPAPQRTDATVGGPAQTLLLLLWGRAALDDPRLVVTGDREAARAVLQSGIVP